MSHWKSPASRPVDSEINVESIGSQQDARIQLGLLAKWMDSDPLNLLRTMLPHPPRVRCGASPSLHNIHRLRR